MKKIKCPKCRKILFRYEDDMGKGKIIINMECSDCKSMIIVNLDTEIKQNNKEYLGKLDYDDNEFLKWGAANKIDKTHVKELSTINDRF